MRTRFVGVMLVVLMAAIPAAVEALDVRVSAIGPDTVVIEWDESQAQEFGYYQIWKEDTSGTHYTIVDVWTERSKTTYTDDDVHAGTEYSYMVRVLDEEDHLLDEGSISITPCLERNWGFLFAGVVFLVILAIFFVVIGMNVPPQILVPIVVALVAVGVGLIYLSNVFSNIPACG
ncbi:MAG: fibronectin type III domain-containing protein [Thermoplasmata archaeon]|nr:fibronectin type III domain-containing protein [Thermoplasmata archaeon]